MNFMRRMRKKKLGVAITEYAVLLAFTALVGSSVLNGNDGLSNSVETKVSTVASMLGGESSGGGGGSQTPVYDANGFDANGIHKDTGTKWDADGFNQRGYNSLGQDRDGNQVVTMLGVFDGYYWAFGTFSTSSAATTGVESIDMSKYDTSAVTMMGYMFGYCNELTSLDLSYVDTSNATCMYEMFYNCESLTSLDFSKFDTSNVTEMWGMFDNCRSLTSLDLSSFDTSNVTSMSSMFKSCSSLTSLDLSNFDTSSVEAEGMADMFYGCTNLKSIKLGGSVWQYLDDSNSYVPGDVNVFYNCDSLTTIYVPKNQLAEYQSRYSGQDFASKFVGY